MMQAATNLARQRAAPVPLSGEMQKRDVGGLMFPTATVRVMSACIPAGEDNSSDDEQTSPEDS